MGLCFVCLLSFESGDVEASDQEEDDSRERVIRPKDDESVIDDRSSRPDHEDIASATGEDRGDHPETDNSDSDPVRRCRMSGWVGHHRDRSPGGKRVGGEPKRKSSSTHQRTR